MKKYKFNQEHVLLAEDCKNTSSVKAIIKQMIGEIDNLPQRSDAVILIKPNLNNDLSALTGNSTDLRVLVALIQNLQQQGYTNITIADGPNVGIYRKGIDVFDRLGLRCLAEKLDVRLIDLNHSAYVQVEVESGFVRVAEPCLQADYLINVPKIKTHAEAGMSVAVKNLMGCVVGADTRIMHLDLGANLVRLNQAVQPDLILVDGLIGMEGNGPGDGSPRRLDLLLAGRDPYELDLLVSRLMGLDAKESSYLKVAQQKGIIDDDVLRQMEDIDPMVTLEAPPQRSLVTRILEHHSLGRLRDLTRFIHGSEWARRLLYRFRIMQDVYETSEANVETLILEHELCDRCGLCLDVCPVELPITDKDFDFYASSDCLGCLYCAFICPQEAIQIVGELGYLEAHLARYGESMRSL
jgi:uncharacterized protein (DUF362 family)/ferredoxin